MTEPLPELDPYPDIELALCDYLEHIAPTVTVLTDLSLTDQIRIQRVAGGDAETTDNPRVRITAYALPTEQNPRASQDMARRIALALRELDEDPQFIANTLIESAAKESGPVSYPAQFENPLVRATDQVFAFRVGL